MDDQNVKVNCMHCGSHIANQHRHLDDVIVVPLETKGVILKSRARVIKHKEKWYDDKDHYAVLNVQLECLNCNKKTTHECRA